MQLKPMKYSFHCDEGDGNVITLATEELSTPEIAERFYYFMLGCSFNSESVLEALQSVIDEHTHYQPKYDAETAFNLWKQVRPDED